jgi:hypothetical protein
MINVKKRVKPTKAEREAIVEWLMRPMLEANHKCPFIEIMECENTPESVPLCASWFPKGVTSGDWVSCPCSCYPRKTVVKYANMMLRAI